MMVTYYFWLAVACLVGVHGFINVQQSRPVNFVKRLPKISSNFFMDLMDGSVKFQGTNKFTADAIQKNAIVSDDPAVLIVAGPGAGKTSVLAARLAHLLETGQCSPSECLVISFTNNAATQLCNRADDMLSGTVATTLGVVCDTFHGFCSSVIKKHLELIPNLNSRKGLLIADDDDQMKIMLDLMASKGQRPDKNLASNILRQIRYWKETGLGFMGVKKKSLVSMTEKLAYEYFVEYQSKLRSLSALDFGDLLLQTLRLFRQRPDVLDQYRQRFKHILVDEFQDVSPAQYDILRLLVLGVAMPKHMEEAAGDNIPSIDDVGHGGVIDFAEDSKVDAGSLRGRSNPIFDVQSWLGGKPKPHTPAKPQARYVRVFCAGDDDQSIYAWRGAKVELMRRFRFDFPGTKVVKFATSYRLKDDVCIASTNLVSFLPERIAKTLRSFAASTETFSKGFLPTGPPLDGDDENSFLAGNALGDDEDGEANLASTRASIEIRRMNSEEEEIQWIVNYLKEKIGQTGGLSDGRGGSDGVKIQVTKKTETTGEKKQLTIAQFFGGTGKSSSTYADSSASKSVVPDAFSDYSIVILTRTQADLRRITKKLSENDIPFRSRNFGAWVLPADGAAPMNLLRLIASPDDDVAFQSALDNDIVLASIDNEEIAKNIMPVVREIAESSGKSLLEALRLSIIKERLQGKYHITMGRFLKKYDAWREEITRYFRRGENARTKVYSILHAAYTQRWNDAILRTVEELSRSASNFDSLPEFFATIRLEGDFVVDSGGQVQSPKDEFEKKRKRMSGYGGFGMNGHGGAAVNVWVMVMHSTKGLEFDEAILPFWVDGNVPKGDSPDERRLAFVSLTRARVRAMISFSKTQFKEIGKVVKTLDPSPFILELLGMTGPKVDFEVVDEVEGFASAEEDASAAGSHASNAAAATSASAGASASSWKKGVSLPATEFMGTAGNIMGVRQQRSPNVPSSKDVASLLGRSGSSSTATVSSVTSSGSDGASSSPATHPMLSKGIRDSIAQRMDGKDAGIAHDNVRPSLQPPKAVAVANTATGVKEVPAKTVPVPVAPVEKSAEPMSASAAPAPKRKVAPKTPAEEAAIAIGKFAADVMSSITAPQKKVAPTRKRAAAAAASSSESATNKSSTVSATAASATKAKPAAKVASKTIETTAAVPGLTTPYAELTPLEVNRLLYDSLVLKTALKEYFKGALAYYGVARCSIPVDGEDGEEPTTRPISKCTAAQLGKHLLTLMPMQPPATKRTVTR